MSPGSDQGAGGAGGAGATAPRLTSAAGYAAWAPRMEVFLQQRGAEQAHKKKIDAEEFLKRAQQVQRWADEELALALAEADAEDGVSSTSAATSSSGATVVTTGAAALAKKSAARKLVANMIERSQRAYGFIYGALSDELQLQAQHLPQGWAYGLWEWLESKFQSTEDDNVDALLGQWAALAQEPQESFDTYRARVNSLRVLLTRAEEAPSVRVYAFALLGKLQSQYKPAVLALKNETLLKDIKNVDWEAVTRFLNAHERSENRETEESGAIAAAAAARGRSSRGDGSSWSNAARRQNVEATVTGQGGTSAWSPVEKSARQQPQRQRTSSPDLSDRKCFRCNKKGHIARFCHAEMPARSASGGVGHQKYVASSAASEAVGSGDATEAQAKPSSAVSSGPTARTYAAVVREANRYAALSAEQKCTAAVDAVAGLGKDAAAKVSQRDKIVASSLHKKLTEGAWGVDTMASVHVTGNKKVFSGPLRPSKEIRVEVANGDVVSASMTGDVRMQLVSTAGEKVSVRLRVYYSARFGANLLSWGRLKLEGWGLSSELESGSFIMTPKPDRKLVRLCEDECLLTLHPSSAPTEVACPARVAESEADPSQPAGMKIQSTGVLLRMHEKLNHMGVDKLIELLRKGAAIARDLPTLSAQQMQAEREEVLECMACKLGKMRRTPFGHHGLDRGCSRGEVLHMDTFFQQLTDGIRSWTEYGVTMSDPWTGYKWFVHVMTKDKIAREVIDIVNHAQTQLGCVVKRMYMDGGSEFVNQTVATACKQRGIEPHWPPKETPQLNGIAERWGQTLKNCTTTMMLHAGDMPGRFWPTAAAHATFVWNRSHVSSTTGHTPMEAMRGVKPSVKHWGVYGCDVFYHLSKRDRSCALGARAEQGIYLGHDWAQNCAKVWSITRNKQILTRDVVFRNTSFTLARALKAGLKVAPQAPLLDDADSTLR